VYRSDEEEKEAIWRVIESGWLFRYDGEESSLHQVDQFEAQFAQRMGVPHTDTHASRHGSGLLGSQHST